MNQIPILVAGIANPHIPGYCRGFANNPEYPWRIVAFAESDPVRMSMAQKILEGKDVKFYSDWRKMLDAHPEVDSFQIGSDNKFHFEMFKECMARGKNIYSTKVATMDQEEGEQLLKLYCHYPQWRSLRCRVRILLMDSYLLILSLSRCKFVLGSEHDRVPLAKHAAKIQNYFES